MTRALRRRMDALTTGAPNPDSGVAAILVVVLFGTGVLLALSALTIDVGSLYAERRQLQNGADSGALAVAQDVVLNCSTGPCVPASRAQTYANSNSKDNTSQVLEVCGGGWPPLAACGAQNGPTITQCPAVPGGVTKWVRVRTATRTSGGGTLLPPWFAQTLTGAGSGGTTVLACAQAGLDYPSSLTATLPITISLCEWNNYTAGGTSYAAPPPYPPYPLAFERALYYHDTGASTHCPAGPSGADLPGGFGWLHTVSGQCQALVNDQSWVDDNTGNGIPNQCNNQLQPLLGTIVFLPIYDDSNGLNGANGSYHLSGFAAFYLTGYSFPGDRQNSVASGTRYCVPSQSCLYGWFTTGLAPPGSTSGGTPRGTATVKLIG